MRKPNIITGRQQWNDNRLAFNSIGGKIRYLTMTEKDKVRERERDDTNDAVS